MIDKQLEKVLISEIEYIHVSWRRELNLDEKNKWIEPINDFDDICWTTIASTDGNSNARSPESGYYIDKDSVEIHCGIAEKS